MPPWPAFLPALAARGPPSSSRATCAPRRAAARACSEPRGAPLAPPQPPPQSQPAPLADARPVPPIFSGPEAVVAVLLAAAAVLTDFVRNVVRLSSGARAPFDVGAAQSSVAELREALRLSRDVLQHTEHRLSAASAQRADAQHASVDADRMRRKIDSATQHAEAAARHLHHLQAALSSARQKRLAVADDKGRLDLQRQQVEGQIAEKRRLMQQISEQIESAKRKQAQIMQQVKFQQQLLDNQLEQARAKLAASDGHEKTEAHSVKGGDSARSEMSLQEVKRNLSAERLALSAEIAEAQVAKDTLTQEEIDALQLLKREMKAKQDGMRAKLKKAQTTVDREESEIQRREDAIEQILDSVDKEKAEKKGSRNTRKSLVGDETAQEELHGRKSGVQKESADDALSAVTEEGVDAFEDKLETSEKAASKRGESDRKASITAEEGKATKRTRTRRRTGSGEGDSANASSKTRKPRAAKKAGAETRDDTPLTVEEAKAIRMSMEGTSIEIGGTVLPNEAWTQTELETSRGLRDEAELIGEQSAAESATHGKDEVDKAAEEEADAAVSDGRRNENSVRKREGASSAAQKDAGESAGPEMWSTKAQTQGRRNRRSRSTKQEEV